MNEEDQEDWNCCPHTEADLPKGVSYCEACGCMSKTVDGTCGKCGVEKE